MTTAATATTATCPPRPRVAVRTVIRRALRDAAAGECLFCLHRATDGCLTCGDPECDASYGLLTVNQADELWAERRRWLRAQRAE